MQNKRNTSEENALVKKNEAPKGFHIEIDRTSLGISTTVSGVLSIIDFNDSFAILKLRGGKIKIFGKKLQISVYEGRAVGIEGKIGGVEFI